MTGAMRKPLVLVGTGRHAAVYVRALGISLDPKPFLWNLMSLKTPLWDLFKPRDFSRVSMGSGVSLKVGGTLFPRAGRAGGRAWKLLRECRKKIGSLLCF